MSIRRKSLQKGVTLLELMLVIALMSVMTMLTFYEKQASLEQTKARQVGAYLFEYNNAVRNALAQGMITSTTTKTGADWLKNSTCGGTLAVNKELLPCDFPTSTIADPIRFGKLSLSTSIVVTGTAPSRKIVATTSTSPFTVRDVAGTAATARADLAGVAAMSAAAALMSGFQTGGANGVTPYTATTDSSYKSDPKTAKITFVASNSAENDVWLRTDGGNSMHASLQFDGTDPLDRQIFGASRISNLAGQVIRIGNEAAMAPATMSSVVVDASAEILGDFRVRKSLVVDGAASVTGNITSGGSINANGNITGANVTASGSITAGAEISAANVTTNGAVIARGGVQAPIYYDSDNLAYYVNPDSTSNINSLVTQTINSSGRIRTGEYLELGGVATEGLSCSTNGLLASSSSGGALTCENGTWRKMGGGDPKCISILINGYSANDVTVYQCPATYTKVGFDTTGQGWRSSVTPGMIIGSNDYAIVFCCQF